MVQFLVVTGGLVFLVVRGATDLDYNWQWYRIPRYLYTVVDGQFIPGPLLEGLAVTFKITGISLLLAFAVGLVTAFFRLSRSPLARIVARVYLEVARNTPLLVQLFFIYFVLAPVLGIDRFTSAVLALSFFEGAYASEIFRAGIVSIHRGQWEAAFSIGLTTAATYRLVVLPQAIRRVLPPLTSQAVSLIKDSALVSTIAVYDLTMRGQAVIAETYLTFEIWLTVAAIYIVVTATLSLTVWYMEKRLDRGRQT
jgi:polar amino acid transport system permease protein